MEGVVWQTSVYCVYYTVCRENIKPCGLKSTKDDVILSLISFILSAFV